MTPSCSACRFANQTVLYNENQCRRRAPVIDEVPPARDLRRFVPVWPIVRDCDWCGEFEMKGGTP